MDVTVDQTTAHPNLKVFDDGKAVQWEKEAQQTNELGYDVEPCVLGTFGRSDRTYWEVQVEDKDDWLLGVARSETDRKGQLVLKPSKGFWVIQLSNTQSLKAMNENEEVIDKNLPKKVGIYLNYPEKIVAFYNVDEKSLIYKFTNGPEYDQKVSPLFSPSYNDRNPIKICPSTQCQNDITQS